MLKIKSLFWLLLLSSTLSCQQENNSTTTIAEPEKIDSLPTVEPILPKGKLTFPWMENPDFSKGIANQIPVPKNFNRIITKDGSFENWLQFLPLFPEGQKVMLHDGAHKRNQSAHHRVVDIDVGKRDLQQCADAVMRLRAEYLFGKNEFEKIHFNYTNGTQVTYQDWQNGRRPVVQGNNVVFVNNHSRDDSYAGFKKYLIQIFSYAGTASLEKEMQAISMKDMQIGDVLIQGGHPGHAVIVVDMAENSKGEKLYLLAQSYMPAQNIHILKNPMNEKLSPWYQLVDNQEIRTPEWTFGSKDLKRF